MPSLTTSVTSAYDERTAEDVGKTSASKASPHGEGSVEAKESYAAQPDASIDSMFDGLEIGEDDFFHRER